METDSGSESNDFIEVDRVLKNHRQKDLVLIMIQIQILRFQFDVSKCATKHSWLTIGNAKRPIDIFSLMFKSVLWIILGRSRMLEPICENSSNTSNWLHVRYNCYAEMLNERFPLFCYVFNNNGPWINKRNKLS